MIQTYNPTTRKYETHYLGKPFEPNIASIAHSLAHINRFTGHAGEYNVAAHSIACSYVAPKGFELSALLHDAPESYLGDVSSPLKKYLSGYAELEHFYHGVIDKFYGVDTCAPEIKHVDMRMLVSEAMYFGIDLGRDLGLKPYHPSAIVTCDPEMSAKWFLKRFNELSK